MENTPSQFILEIHKLFHPDDPEYDYFETLYENIFRILGWTHHMTNPTMMTP